MTSVLRFLTVVALLCLGLTARAGETASYGTLAGSIVVPAGLEGREIQRGIMEVGAEEDFIVRAKDDEKVVLYQEDGRWVMVLTFVYTTEEIQVYSKSARGGEMQIPARPIKKLRKEISRKLNTVAITK